MKLKNKTLVYTASAAAVVSLLASFTAQAVDAFDANTQLLTLDAVSLGGTTYNNVRATVSAYTLLGVDGGTPVEDTFDATTNLLTMGAVTFQGATYNNVRVRISTYTLLSVGSTPGTGVVYANLSGASLGAGASLNGAIPFPASNAWNTDISGAAVDANSDALIASIGLTRGLHPDFGSGLYEGAPIGIPYVVVSSAQPKVAVTFTDYGDESDSGPYPIPADAPIEGQQANGSAFGGDPPCAGHRPRCQPPVRNRQLLSAGRWRLASQWWSRVPHQLQHRAPRRPTRLDQRRRGGSAHLPRSGAV